MYKYIAVAKNSYNDSSHTPHGDGNLMPYANSDNLIDSSHTPHGDDTN